LQTDEEVQKEKQNTFRNAGAKRKGIDSVALCPVSLQEPLKTQRDPTPAHGGRKVHSVFLTVKQRQPTFWHEASGGRSKR